MVRLYLDKDVYHDSSTHKELQQLMKKMDDHQIEKVGKTIRKMSGLES